VLIAPRHNPENLTNAGLGTIVKDIHGTLYVNPNAWDFLKQPDLWVLYQGECKRSLQNNKLVRNECQARTKFGDLQKDIQQTKMRFEKKLLTSGERSEIKLIVQYPAFLTGATISENFLPVRLFPLCRIDYFHYQQL
jgi:hypothetical protein